MMQIKLSKQILLTVLFAGILASCVHHDDPVYRSLKKKAAARLIADLEESEIFLEKRIYGRWRKSLTPRLVSLTNTRNAYFQNPRTASLFVYIDTLIAVSAIARHDGLRPYAENLVTLAASFRSGNRFNRPDALSLLIRALEFEDRLHNIFRETLTTDCGFDTFYPSYVSESHFAIGEQIVITINGSPYTDSVTLSIKNEASGESMPFRLVRTEGIFHLMAKAATPGGYVVQGELSQPADGYTYTGYIHNRFDVTVAE